MTFIVSTMLKNAAHRRALRELLSLDDRILRDIGTTRADVAFMIARRNDNAGRRNA